MSSSDFEKLKEENEHLKIVLQKMYIIINRDRVKDSAKEVDDETTSKTRCDKEG